MTYCKSLLFFYSVDESGELESEEDEGINAMEDYARGVVMYSSSSGDDSDDSEQEEGECVYTVQVEIYTEFNLATWLRMVKFTELNISEF